MIKNGHTASELAESGERWINHHGPYLTLAETIAIEKAKQKAKLINRILKQLAKSKAVAHRFFVRAQLLCFSKAASTSCFNRS